MIATYGFYLAQPLWLLTALLTAPIVWLAVRSLKTLSGTRRTLAISLRVLLVVLLAALLARPTLTRRSGQLTVIAVVEQRQVVRVS